MTSHRASRQLVDDSERHAGATPSVAAPLAPLLELQRLVGNRAVARAFSGSRAPPGIARGGRRGAPAQVVRAHGAAVRVFDDFESHRAAAELGAYAYAWQGDVFLGAGLGRPGLPARDAVVRHELVHALQARRPGAKAAARELEAEAHARPGTAPQLAADPDEPLGAFWVIPVAIGLYILLRPGVANAPGPGDPVQPSVSTTQVAGEALALFAIPGGVAGALGRAGYGVVASFAISGAAGSVAYRGVQDVGAGQFSGVEAYVVDAATGAVIGLVIGGIFRPFVGARPGAGTPPLVHLTDRAGAAGIGGQGVLRGGTGIWAVPEAVAAESTAMRAARTLIAPSRTQIPVAIPRPALPFFRPPTPIGPLSLYQRLMGVFRAPPGAINLATGEFAASGSRLANLRGQFFPYGADAMIWISGAYFASRASPSDPEAYDRGLYGPIYDLIGQGTPLPPVTTRSDGPFVLGDPSMLATGIVPPIDDPLASIFVGDPTAPAFAADPNAIYLGGGGGGAGGAGGAPLIILVTPLPTDGASAVAQ